ncbi:RNA polymerase sigma factor [Mucilaginibacter gotjawali]|uniref:ECF RNA polymerase sigma factor SigE n=2 Tax=Mucilaginibacter gotjawali TaxID=1550579 RepID=A0A0X8X3P0_9SPHI|nr:sigma-70 family RNA polymerase sigma factor [Mucilaginibacter gotjawali]MBB3056402.1 RNA polymerase sigma-70 factor (ECF subfamily) [Mucilaginibacter gotjawali]BAU55109.1 ECF RNA polymerase sigma factor SigE [Mucilaginibacter gotjawali]
MGEGDLQELIKGCIKQDRKCQKELYKAFYGFAMGICLRYAGNRDEAAEVTNLGFFKVFSKIGKFNDALPFKAWLGRIMINTSIDFYRSKLKLAFNEDLDQAAELSDGELPDRNLNYEDLLKMVQALPHAYRTVFNLFAIEGYSHEEIAAMLHISTGTSKSNLYKARQKLKDMILQSDSRANSANYNSGMDYTHITFIKMDDALRMFLNKGFKK